MATKMVAIPLSGSLRTMSRSKRVLIFLHLWLGLSCGLVFVVMGLSGSLLVFAPELDAVFTPQLVLNAGHAQVTHYQLDACRAEIVATHPGWKLMSVNLPTRADGSLQWFASQPGNAGRYTIFTDASTCKVLGQRMRRQYFLGWLMDFHHQLLMGSDNQWILGYVAIGIFTLVVTGILLWWPSSWSAERFKFRKSARPLHYAIGFWLFVPLLLISSTAIYMGFHDILMPKLLGNKPGQKQAQKKAVGTKEHGDKPQPSLDVALATAQAAQPQAFIAALRMKGANDPITAAFQVGGQKNTRSIVNNMELTPQPDGTFQVTKTMLISQRNFGARLTYLIPMLHYGDLFGYATRALLSFTGLMPGVLLVTGFLMWRRRVRAKQITEAALAQRAAKADSF